MITKYYKILAGYSTDVASGLFRTVENETLFNIEYYGKDGQWHEDNDLIRFVMGSPLAEEINEKEASALIKSWTRNELNA